MRVFHAILSSLVTRCCGTIEIANICEGVVQRENTHRYGKLKSFRNWGQPEFDGQKQADHAILSSLVTRCCGTIETANICEGVVQRENTHRYGKLKSFRNWGQPEFDGQKQADSDHPK